MMILDKQNHEENIRIRPQMRYVLVRSMTPVLYYLTAVGVILWGPALPSWLFYTIVGLMVLSLLAIIWTILNIYCTEWVLTADQLSYRRGVIARRIDYVELYRVTDYIVQMTVTERLLGLSSFYVVSTDMTSAVVHIFGLPDVSGLQDEIRKRVEIQRSVKRIYEIGNHT